jgi:hypothetical protein
VPLDGYIAGAGGARDCLRAGGAFAKNDSTPTKTVSETKAGGAGITREGSHRAHTIEANAEKAASALFLESNEHSTNLQHCRQSLSANAV